MLWKGCCHQNLKKKSQDLQKLEKPSKSLKLVPLQAVWSLAVKSLEAQKQAREFFNKTNKPFLSVFAGNDPVTNDMEKDVLKMVPNAIKAKNIGGGHFFQWTKPKELSKVLIDFIKD